MIVPGVGILMSTIEDALREALFPAIFIGDYVITKLREILCLSINRVGLGIPDPQLSAECAYNTSKESSDLLVLSLLGGTNLNFVVHKGCGHRVIVNGQKQQEFTKTKALMR